MEKFSKLLFALLMAFAVVSVSCNRNNNDDDDNNTDNNKFGTLKTYLVDNNMDIDDVVKDWITTAENVYTAQTDADPSNDYYIIDLRSATDFAAGHIDGAVNSTLADVLTTAGNAGGKPIIVACYTGQTAGHAVLALRLSNYPNAKVMKWGMSGWTDASGYDKWTPNTGSTAVGHSNWTAAPGSITDNFDYGDPTLESTETGGAEILAERVQALLNDGMNKITNADVLADPSQFYINNYWDVTDVEHYGHIAGAFRVKPLTLEGEEYKYLNPNATVITYCWTGQTSSMVTAYLKVLGYNSKSLLFGSNGMIYSELQSHKWSAAQIKQYPVVTK